MSQLIEPAHQKSVTTAYMSNPTTFNTMTSSGGTWTDRPSCRCYYIPASPSNDGNCPVAGCVLSCVFFARPRSWTASSRSLTRVASRSLLSPLMPWISVYAAISLYWIGLAPISLRDLVARSAVKWLSCSASSCVRLGRACRPGGLVPESCSICMRNSRWLPHCWAHSRKRVSFPGLLRPSRPGSWPRGWRMRTRGCGSR
jgi:hypothetical protein